MKTVLEPSVRIDNTSYGTCTQPDPPLSTRRGMVDGLSTRSRRTTRAWSRIGDAAALPGAEPSTYRTKGSPAEHGNPASSAGEAIAGKLPSPAMSRRGDGVSVVVGARESRAQGEGRQ
jgi:hypothetical protein